MRRRKYECYLPRSSSLSSLRAFLLSRCSCFSISALIRRCSRISSGIQQAIPARSRLDKSTQLPLKFRWSAAVVKVTDRSGDGQTGSKATTTTTTVVKPRAIRTQKIPLVTQCSRLDLVILNWSINLLNSSWTTPLSHVVATGWLSITYRRAKVSPP